MAGAINVGTEIVNNIIVTGHLVGEAVTKTQTMSGPFATILTSEEAVFASTPAYLSVPGVVSGGKVVISFQGSFTRTGGHSPTVTLRLYRGTNTSGALLATAYSGGSGVAQNQPFQISAVDGGFSGDTFYFLTAQSDDSTCTINNGLLTATNFKNG